MQFKPLIEYDAFAEFLFDTAAAGRAAASIAEKHAAVKGRERELLQLRSALFADKVSIQDVKTMLGKAFGLSDAELDSLYADFVGYFVLPLESYVPEIASVLTDTGAEVSEYPEYRVSKEARTAEELIEEVLAERDVEINPDLKKRLVFLSNAYLTGDRDREKTKLLFMRGSNLGGLELSDAAAENFLKELDEELEVTQVVVKDEKTGHPELDSVSSESKNDVIPEKAGIQSENSPEGESALDPLIQPDRQAGKSEDDDVDEAEEVVDHLNEVQEDAKQSSPEPLTAETSVKAGELQSAEASEETEKPAHERGGNLEVKDENKAIGNTALEIPDQVRNDDTTKGPQSGAPKELSAEPDNVLAEAGIFADDFEDEPTKESMYERAVTANAVELKAKDGDKAPVSTGHPELNSESSESDTNVIPVEAGIQSEDSVTSTTSTEASLPALAVTHALAKEVPVISGSILHDLEEEELSAHAEKAEQASSVSQEAMGSMKEMLPELLASTKKQLAAYEIPDAALEGIVTTMLRGIRDARHVEKLLADRYGADGKDIRQVIATLTEAKQHIDLSLRPGIGEPMVDLSANQPKKRKMKPVTPPQQKAPASGAMENRSVDGIQYEKRSVGPIDEIRGLTVEAFRRLGLDADQLMNEMKQRFNLIRKERYADFELAIDAWTDCEVYGVYTEMVLSAIERGESLSNIASERRKSGQKTLSAAEIEAITHVNHFLHI